MVIHLVQLDCSCVHPVLQVFGGHLFSFLGGKETPWRDSVSQPFNAYTSTMSPQNHEK